MEENVNESPTVNKKKKRIKIGATVTSLPHYLSHVYSIEESFFLPAQCATFMEGACRIAISGRGLTSVMMLLSNQVTCD